MHIVFLILLILASSSPPIANAYCFFTPKWKLYVLNSIPADTIVTHVRSKDDDLGKHIIPSNGYYYWSFCDTIDRSTHFDGEFWWGRKYQCLEVFYKLARWKCDRFGFSVEYCFWLVRPDGFYISSINISFPDPLWTFVKSWVEVENPIFCSYRS
ncbi:putative plant self-incompatibility S1 [Helianthus annuus]|nr:putative plant self-incompatibility S1 [Helianthus annuus]KAJ0812150.1 putative plant self-incompatibility S1 [Helianthus annuus]